MMTLQFLLPIEKFAIVTLALSNAMGAILILAMAQAVTKGAGIKCWLAFIRGIQRVLMYGLAGAMANMAAYIYEEWWAPPMGGYASFLFAHGINCRRVYST